MGDEHVPPHVDKRTSLICQTRKRQSKTQKPAAISMMIEATRFLLRTPRALIKPLHMCVCVCVSRGGRGRIFGGLFHAPGVVVVVGMVNTHDEPVFGMPMARMMAVKMWKE